MQPWEMKRLLEQLLDRPLVKKINELMKQYLEMSYKPRLCVIFPSSGQ